MKLQGAFLAILFGMAGVGEALATSHHTLDRVVSVKQAGKRGAKITLTLRPDPYHKAVKIGLGLADPSKVGTYTDTAYNASAGYLLHQFAEEINLAGARELTLELTYGQGNSFKGGETVDLITAWTSQPEAEVVKAAQQQADAWRAQVKQQIQQAESQRASFVGSLGKQVIDDVAAIHKDQAEIGQKQGQAQTKIYQLQNAIRQFQQRPAYEQQLKGAQATRDQLAKDVQLAGLSPTLQDPGTLRWRVLQVQTLLTYAQRGQAAAGAPIRADVEKVAEAKPLLKMLDDPGQWAQLPGAIHALAVNIGKVQQLQSQDAHVRNLETHLKTIPSSDTQLQADLQRAQQEVAGHATDQAKLQQRLQALQQRPGVAQVFPVLMRLQQLELQLKNYPARPQIFASHVWGMTRSGGTGITLVLP